MGNNNSSQSDELTNEQIIANISKFFGGGSIAVRPLSTQVSSINIDAQSNQIVSPEQKRYREIEKQLNEQTGGFAFLRNLFGTKSETPDISSLSEFDGGNTDTSNDYMSDLPNVNELSKTSQTARKQTEELPTLGLSSLSVTQFSQSNPPSKMTGGCCMTGGCTNCKTESHSSEVANVIPFLTTSECSEYYNAIQREHRYV